MSDTELAPPTSTGTTKETEPEVWAAITSAEGDPSLPTLIETDKPRFGYGTALLLFAGACAAGYGVSLWVQRRGGET